MSMPMISNGLPAIFPIAIPATNNPSNPKERSTIVLHFKSNPRALPPLHTINPKIDDAIRTTNIKTIIRITGFDGNIFFQNDKIYIIDRVYKFRRFLQAFL